MRRRRSAPVPTRGKGQGGGYIQQGPTRAQSFVFVPIQNIVFIGIQNISFVFKMLWVQEAGLPGLCADDVVRLCRHGERDKEELLSCLHAQEHELARGCVVRTSLIRKRTPLEHYRRPMPRVVGWP